MTKKQILIFLIGASVASVVLRLLPHPANVTPMAALALFSGVYGTKVSKWVLALPIVLMAGTDLIVGTYHWQVMIAVYASFLAIAGIGLLVQRMKNVGTITLGTLGGTLLFFLATNAAVWAFSGMYQLNLAGLMLSYAMAIPFLKLSLVGDLFYTAVFFGMYEFLKNYGVFRLVQRI
ncbi:MAG: hypothetical protein A3C04_02535 [Candidatus Wildermuthbacteria bacterium RIFCSPHIGHO2_02_FULL_45_25]|uniref:Biotin transporter n=1 Tax=Candidatus Wildermuthbacteria bacterium RIFCSPHIGHO2_02_FULL_45_25 TaxID=1802450 RepID=A0A1G2R3I4_9BACT|nr:MAG: hypothetical protein A3C04_02535 [Candidatus Wildermuthbacteria bacterium RIFCSPHIGHO2_02_FULL_45_25]